MTMECEAKHLPSRSKSNRRFKLDVASHQDDPEACHSLLEDREAFQTPVTIPEKVHKYECHQNKLDRRYSPDDSREPLLKSILKDPKSKQSPESECEIDEIHPIEKLGDLIQRSNIPSNPSISDGKEHSYTEIIKRSPESSKTAVHFGDPTTAHLHPTAGPSNQTFRQRASFQSETRNLTASSQRDLGNQDNGVICSNNDLRLILCEANHLRRNSSDAKRERTKSTRSLSFDSSVFRFRRGNSFDSSVWFSKNVSPLHLKCQDEEFLDNSHKSVIQIRVTADSPELEKEKLERLYEAGTEDYLEAETTEETIVLMSSEDQDSSKVTWDDKSIVDASVLGNAIEAYLNSEERRLSSNDQGQEMLKTQPLTDENPSICSTLKSMFVK